MILNNTHVQGMFLYSEETEYEKGDFVVYGNTIYICTAKNPTNKTNNTVSGVIPEESSDNYSPYLGDKLNNIEEYFNYINHSEEEQGKEDKLITAHLLSQILSTYMIGFDEKGIISEYVYLNSGNDSLSISSELSDFLNGTGIDSKNVLSMILISPEINNAVFKISRNLPEISEVIFNDASSIYPEDANYVILRQYTYTNEPNSDSIYRLQELIDPIGSVVRYRYGKGYNNGDQNTFDSVTSWLPSSIDKEWMENIKKLEKLYLDKIEELNNLEKSLVNNFRFKEYPIPETANVIEFQCTDNTKDNYLPVSGFDKESFILTVITQENNINTTISIDLLDAYMSHDAISSYYLTDSSALVIVPGKTEGNKGEIVRLYVTSGNIVNIFYRDKYKK
jgi:hypothetical protein|nr:MAG TPA: hypothetical protein [Bacteriophage sp.]